MGQGSYAAVYKARNERDGSIVGVKILDVDSETLPDIKKEIQILQDMDSEHIVACRGVHQPKGQKVIWIVMEYCAAGSLSDMMSVCKRTLTEEQIACVMKQSLAGLTYLHGQKIIHRDIKAANLLLTGQADCKLADFGVSAEIATTLSRKRTIIGTPNWMAPEVIKASAYNEKADVWSLGITAIELAVGAPPHSDVHPMTAMFKIPSAPPPTLPNPSMWSKDFHNFIKVCLRKNLDQRPSAAQLLLYHPFVLKAKPQEQVLLPFVQDCMKELTNHRAGY